MPAPLAARAPPGRQEGAVGKDRGRRDQKLYGYRRHQVVGDCEAPCEPDPEAVPRALREPPRPEHPEGVVDAGTVMKVII